MPETIVSITLAASEFSLTTSGGATKSNVGTSLTEDLFISLYGKKGFAFTVPVGIEIKFVFAAAAVSGTDANETILTSSKFANGACLKAAIPNNIGSVITTNEIDNTTFLLNILQCLKVIDISSSAVIFAKSRFLSFLLKYFCIFLLLLLTIKLLSGLEYTKNVIRFKSYVYTIPVELCITL